MDTTVGRRLFVAYLACAVTLTVAGFIGSVGSGLGPALRWTASLITVLALVAGLGLHRPARKLPWLLLLASVVAGTSGAVVFAWYLKAGEPPYPSGADALWLASLGIQLTGVTLLVNGFSWRRDPAGILDTMIVTVGLGLGVWLLFLRDLLDPAMSPAARLVTIAYPLGDLLLLATAIRLSISAARRSPAFVMLTASLVVQSSADFVGAWQISQGVNNLSLAPAFALSAMLLGGAALHPSMARFAVVSQRPGGQATPLRVALIGSMCLLSPVLLIIEGITGDGRVDWLAASLCCVVVFLLVIARMVGLVRTVHHQAAELEALAYLDSLTGIPNRRAWDAELRRRLAVARRHGEVLVVGIIDIDHFKCYNDMFGHPAGDQLLRDASTAWQAQLRPEDLIARYGGEEFGLIMHCRLRDAAIVMDRLRDATPEGQTFSAGLALWTGQESPDQLTARADAALYAAKRDGRDRFTVTGDPGRTDLVTDFLAVHAVSSD
ncbi:GGDEF domain-containing protein [Paractinoplanes ferrugineus]|uniref:GGDEF domain-containing protein n=1 Tax=Paractinoplanes ferrugineus TaxID=113564 RepID=UPI001940974D|nr:GGDEF domain-containing protein [Actinoplanes ferrugineus]